MLLRTQNPIGMIKQNEKYRSIKIIEQRKYPDILTLFIETEGRHLEWDEDGT